MAIPDSTVSDLGTCAQLEASVDETRRGQARRSAGLALFTVLWALGASLHVLGNPENPSDLAVYGIALAVGLALARPSWPPTLTIVGLATIAAIWSEAPILGNHWMLAGMIGLAAVVALCIAGRDPSRYWARFAPAARWCLLGFYAFAAFAKLNHDFFNPDVSCAPFYLRESAASFGVGTLADPPRWIGYATVWGTALLELSIPVLLVMRRTRCLGVLVALTFHFMLALDRTHQFYDFSAILLPLFVLFLPEQFAVDVRDAVVSHIGRVTRIAMGAGAAALTAVAATTEHPNAMTFLIGWPAWQALGVVSLVVVVVWLVRHRHATPSAPERAFRLHPVMAVAVALVVVNGLTPYTEVKTAFGWNMYANLRTVAGDSNHYIIRDALPLNHDQEEVIEIVQSDDPGLEFYATNRYGLTERRLRAYLHDHPDVTLTMRRDGGPNEHLAGPDVAAFARAEPEWQRKLLVHRAVDLGAHQRCQDVFGPAA
jgi:hypothetical protein